MKNINKMKHIKLFEKFLNFDEELLKDDIDGILVELKDEGFEITTSIFKTMGRKTISITLHREVNDQYIDFNTNDINIYILTLVDYIKYKLDKDIYIEYLYWDYRNNMFSRFDFNDENKNMSAFKLQMCEERVTGDSKWLL
jgi:hypothetical protein